MRKYFLTGLVTLAPLALTIWVVQFLVDFLTTPFIDIVTALTEKLPIHSFGIFTSKQIIRAISQIFILVGLFLLVFFLGFVARQFFFGQLLSLGDRFLYKIPIVNRVYKTSKEIVKSLFGSKKGSFKQAVLIPFPYPGAYCIGLIARESPKTCSNAMGGNLVSIFIPTTPNPTTGFLVMCESSELIYLDMKTDEALKYIVSCAVIQPKGPE